MFRKIFVIAVCSSGIVGLSYYLSSMMVNASFDIDLNKCLICC